MSFSNTKNKEPYVATEGQTTFQVTFQVYSTMELEVYMDGVLAESGYSVTLPADPSRIQDNDYGEVVFDAGLAVGVKVLLYRIPKLNQEDQFAYNGPLPASVVERILDRVAQVNVWQDERLGRCFSFPVSSEIANVAFTDPEDGTVWVYNAATNAMDNKKLVGLGALTLPVAVALGGTGASEAEAALVALGGEPLNTDILKADTAQLLQAVYGDEAQIHTGIDLSNLTVNRNHIEWRLTANSAFSLVTLPYDGTYIFHVYPNEYLIWLSSSYKTDGNLADPDSAAFEIRIVVEIYLGRRSIISLQNMEV